MVAVAAIFQKDPSVLIAHPGQGNDSLAALKGKPIMIGADTRIGSWLFLKQKFGYTDDQIRPYTFSVAPFLADPKAIQQGYLTSEPFTIEKAGREAGRACCSPMPAMRSYGSLIQTSDKLAQEKPDLVQRFVDASIEGWYSYLYGDPAPGNALIKKDNPEMTDALLAYGIAQDQGIRHRRQRRRQDERHRRNDRRALAGFLRHDVEGRRLPAGPRLPQGLHAAVRQQEGRDEALTALLSSSGAAAIVDAARASASASARASTALDGDRSRRRPRRVPEPARPFGLRQEHLAAHHRRADRAERRARCLRSMSAARRGGICRGGPDRLCLPGPDPDAVEHGRRQRAAAVPHRRAGRRRRARPRRGGDRARSGSPGSSAPIRTSCRAACGCGCRSPARWSPTPTCCCSTSRSPRSTRSPASRSTTICCGCGRRTGRPSCSSPTASSSRSICRPASR